MKVRDFIGRKRGDDELMESVPAGWIRTRAAAEILKVDTRTARFLLRGFKARFVLVKGKANAKFWACSDVRMLAGERECVAYVGAVPKGWCLVSEACRKLGVARASLHRFCRKGLLAERRIRMRTAAGVVLRVVLNRQQVCSLARRRKSGEMACRRHLCVRRALE